MPFSSPCSPMGKVSTVRVETPSLSKMRLISSAHVSSAVRVRQMCCLTNCETPSLGEACPDYGHQNGVNGDVHRIAKW